jgi:hypothetical protein
VFGPTETLAPGALAAHTVNCPANSLALNGGVIDLQAPGEPNVQHLEEQPVSVNDTHGWFERIQNEDEATSMTVKWFAVCSAPATGDRTDADTTSAMEQSATATSLADPASVLAPAQPPASALVPTSITSATTN